MEEKIDSPWRLFVDGSSGRQGVGAEIVLEGPNNILVEHSLIFRFKISNNQAEYEALLVGMELARDLGVEFLECRTDSQLVEGHMNGNFQVKDDQLLQYVHKAKQLASQFKSLELKHILRKESTRADRLSKLTSGKEKVHLSSMVKQILTKPIIECSEVSGVTDR